MSCSRKATGPETVPVPSDSSASSIDNPVRSVARKRASSRAGHANDEILVAGQVGVGVAHHAHHGGDERGRDRPLHAEQVGLPNGPANEATQHVAAILIAREHAVADEERQRPGVIGQDSERHVDLGVLAVGPPRERLGPGDDRAKERPSPRRRAHPGRR